MCVHANPANSVCQRTLCTIHCIALLCLVSPVKAVMMLRPAVGRLGLRMCSTGVTRGPLPEAPGPNSGKMNAALFRQCSSPNVSRQDKPAAALSQQVRTLFKSVFRFRFADMLEFRGLFAKAKHIAIITGAGVSAESGVPTFRGENEKWRKWLSQVL